MGGLGFAILRDMKENDEDGGMRGGQLVAPGGLSPAAAVVVL